MDFKILMKKLTKYKLMYKDKYYIYNDTGQLEEVKPSLYSNDNYLETLVVDDSGKNKTDNFVYTIGDDKVFVPALKKFEEIYMPSYSQKIIGQHFISKIYSDNYYPTTFNNLQEKEKNIEIVIVELIRKLHQLPQPED